MEIFRRSVFINISVNNDIFCEHLFVDNFDYSELRLSVSFGINEKKILSNCF